MWQARFQTRRPCRENLIGCHQQVSPAVVRLQGPSFFGREAERSALQTYLQRSPTTILVLLGPRSSGRTALLHEVLRNSFSDSHFPPAYLDARSRQLSEASVLISLLLDSAATALQKISGILKKFPDSRMGKAFAALSDLERLEADIFRTTGEKVEAQLLGKQSQSMNDVFEVYDEMLNLYKSGKSPGGGWPIICIDEANVLTEWQYGSLKKREAIRALLRFFVKVCEIPASYSVLHFSFLWRGMYVVRSSICDFCRYRGRITLPM